MPADQSSTNINLHLGIDTGGTYTDGVLFDPHRRQIVRTAKVLTTHSNLQSCLQAVLEALNPPEPEAIHFAAISTTLATNAIAENKYRPVALLLLGYDPELVQAFELETQFATPHFFYIKGRHNLDGIEQVPLDEDAVQRITAEICPQVDALAVSSYAGPANAEHERRAAEIITGQCRLPVVQAHHLSSQLDSIRRAATASLNAGLLPEVQEFLDAVQAIFTRHGITCPVAVLRGAGSLVKAEYARQHPVEIIHSGPATSAIGGSYLSGVERALVIDMGGTTTDLILVDQQHKTQPGRGATVGGYRTCVPTLWASSIGLGGDSRIHYDRWRQLDIGPERLLPLAYLTHEFPNLKPEILKWLEYAGEIKESGELEYWVLRRQPQRKLENPTLQQALSLLERRPYRLRALLKQVGVYTPFQLGARELLNAGIIQRAGLTPTDLLHASGDFCAWDAETAMAAVTAAARYWRQTPEVFCREIRRRISARITEEALAYLSGIPLSEPGGHSAKMAFDRWLFTQNLTRSDPNLGVQLRLQAPIVGIGAPARAFLPAVAEALHTEIIIPNHYQVANALGALVSNVVVRLEGLVRPSITGHTIDGFYARLDNRQVKFATYDAALNYAQNQLSQLACEQATQAGALDPQVETRVEQLWEDGARVFAWAAGTMANRGE